MPYKNKRKAREYMRKRYRNDAEFKEKFLEQCRKWRLRNPYRVWANNVKQNHKQRGFKIKVIRKDIEKLARKTNKCLFCGSKLEYGYKGKSGWNRNSPSLDCIDDSRELRKDNIQIICAQCNSAKHKMSRQEFIEYCREIVLRNPL